MGNKKTRRNITLDTEVDEAINEQSADFSPFVNRVARRKFVEGRGHVLEDVLTDELEAEIKDHVKDTEQKLAEMREHADEMRNQANKIDETADEIETELDDLCSLIDDTIESAKDTVKDREEDITATSIADETTWAEVVETLNDMPYHQLAWHREDGGSPPGKPPEHTDSVNEALKNQADKLDIHYDALLDKLVEEGHVERESIFTSVELD